MVTILVTKQFILSESTFKFILRHFKSKNSKKTHTKWLVTTFTVRPKRTSVCSNRFTASLNSPYHSTTFLKISKQSVFNRSILTLTCLAEEQRVVPRNHRTSSSNVQVSQVSWRESRNKLDTKKPSPLNLRYTLTTVLMGVILPCI